MYVDDMKQFAKNEKELETLIRTVRIYSEDIEKEFSIEKCALLMIKSGKRQMTEGIKLLKKKKKKIRTLGEKETNKCLGILEADTIKHKKKVYLRRTRKLLETELHCRNLLKGINNWAVPLVRYSGHS